MSTSKIIRFVIVTVLALTLAACNLLDNGINSGMDKGFGNKQPCSGLVC